MTIRQHWRWALWAALTAAGLPAAAQQKKKGAPPDSAVRLVSVKVVAEREGAPRTVIQAATLPAIATVSAVRVRESVNVMDTEDAVKYLPSVFLRKRNNGDTQAVMGTRVWGVSSSARSLVFVDGIPLSALIANNNTIGGPRWGLVAPNEIERVDIMYGPFSAAYAGNSMGAVLEMSTRWPQRLEGSVEQSQAEQTFDLYGTSRTFGTTQTMASVGDRIGRLAFWASGNYQNSRAQPLTYVTGSTVPTGTSGGYTEFNKLGAPANVLGATGLLHTSMTNAKLKAAYDLTPHVQLGYTFGFWQNNGESGTESYLQRAGEPTFAGLGGFATGNYDLVQRHTSHSAFLRTNTKGDWDWEVVATAYRFNKDQQRSPTTAAASGLDFGSAGRVAVLDGTGWRTLDLKGMWHKGGLAARHSVSFGLHGDRYALGNPTYNTTEWTGGPIGAVATEGDGKTRTGAIWLQDAWRLTPQLKLTIGARYEDWRAFDGYNVNGATQVTQPEVSSSKVSPKAMLAWEASPQMTITGSVGQAYRFATASELYQLVTTGPTFTSPNPNLKPDDVLATELRVNRRFERANVQVALFRDDVHDAMISQFLPLVPNSPTLYSYVSNVDHVRATGVEASVDTRAVGVRNLELSGSITYLHARILALSGSASATSLPSAAVGKTLPGIPDWRGSVVATYRPNERLSFALAGRYSGKVYTTLDNADVHPNTYQGFSEWFVADTKATYRMNAHWSASLGVDNLLNRKYFYFHPFPQRTFVGNLAYGI